jgi:hypothetical protein
MFRVCLSFVNPTVSENPGGLFIQGNTKTPQTHLASEVFWPDARAGFFNSTPAVAVYHAGA